MAFTVPGADYSTYIASKGGSKPACCFDSPQVINLLATATPQQLIPPDPNRVTLIISNVSSGQDVVIIPFGQLTATNGLLLPAASAPLRLYWDTEGPIVTFGWLVRSTAAGTAPMTAISVALKCPTDFCDDHTPLTQGPLYAERFGSEQLQQANPDNGHVTVVGQPSPRWVDNFVASNQQILPRLRWRSSSVGQLDDVLPSSSDKPRFVKIRGSV